MTGLFEEVDEQAYIDTIHLTPKGNEYVARGFLREIKEIIGRRR
jgi:hypothetical protein